MVHGRLHPPVLRYCGTTAQPAALAADATVRRMLLTTASSGHRSCCGFRCGGGSLLLLYTVDFLLSWLIPRSSQSIWCVAPRRQYRSLLTHDDRKEWNALARIEQTPAVRVAQPGSKPMQQVPSARVLPVSVLSSQGAILGCLLFGTWRRSRSARAHHTGCRKPDLQATLPSGAECDQPATVAVCRRMPA
jgi:hypothetical protein